MPDDQLDPQVEITSLTERIADLEAVLASILSDPRSLRLIERETRRASNPTRKPIERILNRVETTEP